MDKTLNDYVKRMKSEGKRIYRLVDDVTGKQLLCGLPPKSCAFCDHCTDVFWDSHGPYMFGCELGLCRNDHEIDCKDYNEEVYYNAGFE